MPVYTDKEKTYQELKRLQGSEYCCAECGATLLLVWGGSYGYECHVLRCAKDFEHKGISKPHTLRHAQIPGFNLYDVTKKRRKKMEQKHGHEATTALAKYQTTALITRQAATEIVETLWKGATPAEKTKAILLCATYNLNPLMNHLFLLPFKTKDGKVSWAVAIGIEATRLMAHRKHNFTYLDLTPRRPTNDELEKILGDQVEKNTVYMITKIKDLKTGAEAYGLGAWQGGVYGADKGNTPVNMAGIRSERQAIKRLYPAEMPTDVEVVDERFVEAAQEETKTVDGHYREVDETTGEIKEGVQASGTPGPATDLMSREFKNAGEMKMACVNDLKMTTTQIDAECAMYDLGNPGQRKQAWQGMIAVRFASKEPEETLTIS